MKKLHGLALASVCVLVAASGCAQTAQKEPPAGEPASPAAQPAAPTGSTLSQDKATESATPTSNLDGKLFYQLLIGEITASGDEPAAGFALILDAARRTNNPQLYQRAVDIALRARSGDGALQAAQAWKAASPDSREANRYLLQILIALGRLEETREPLRTELKLAPEAEREAVFAAIPRGFARATDKKLATSIVEDALSPYLTNPTTATGAWSSVARMRLVSGDPPGSLEAAQRAQAANAQAEVPALVALELMEALPAKAEPMVRKYLDGNPKALPEIRMGYARALLDAQRYAEATSQLQTVTREKPDLAEGWLVLGTLQLQDNQLAQSQSSLERYVVLAQNQGSEADRTRGLSQAYLALAQLAEKRKDFANAESWLGKIENSAELVQAQTRRASILASQGKLDQGRQLIRQLPEKTPADARLKLGAEVNLLREAKQYRPAYDLLGQALEKTPEDAELLYDRAMMAEKLDALDDMERMLRQVIKLKPDYHHAYNALGYSLAERNLRLPEAKELIQKALSYAPADPFIRDSLGWVEFRMGNKAEAARIFDAAYRAKPDAEIAAHYGEVLWSLGQREQAVAIWKEGKLLNPENETLLETLKRLRVSL